MALAPLLEDLMSVSPFCRAVSLLDLETGEHLVSTATRVDWFSPLRNHARRLRDTLPAARGLDLLFSELTGEPEAQSQKIWDMVLLGGEWQMLAVGDGKLGLLSVATPQIDSDTFLYCARFAFEAVLELAPAQLGQLEGGRREASA